MVNSDVILPTLLTRTQAEVPEEDHGLLQSSKIDEFRGWSKKIGRNRGIPQTDCEEFFVKKGLKTWRWNQQKMGRRMIGFEQNVPWWFERCCKSYIDNDRWVEKGKKDRIIIDVIKVNEKSLWMWNHGYCSILAGRFPSHRRRTIVWISLLLSKFYSATCEMDQVCLIHWICDVKKQQRPSTWTERHPDSVENGEKDYK